MTCGTDVMLQPRVAGWSTYIQYPTLIRIQYYRDYIRTSTSNHIQGSSPDICSNSCLIPPLHLSVRTSYRAPRSRFALHCFVRCCGSLFYGSTLLVCLSCVTVWFVSALHRNSRSETMEGYLRCMLVADLAIEAQVRELQYVCGTVDGRCTRHKMHTACRSLAWEG